MLQLNKLREISTKSYPFHFSAYFGHGLHLFGREAGQFIGYTLIHLLLFLSVQAFSKEAALYTLVLLPFFLSGYYVVAKDIDQDKEISFGLFFTGYIHAPALLVLGGGIMLICGIMALPFFWVDPISVLAQAGYPRVMTTLYLTFGMYPVLLPAIFCYSFFRWAPMLFLFSRMSILEALVMSSKLVSRRWFLHFVFTLVLVIVGVYFSTFFFFILSLFLVGVVACVDYASFAQITSLSQDENDAALEEQSSFQKGESSTAVQTGTIQASAFPSQAKVHEIEEHWHLLDDMELREKFELLLQQKERFEFKFYLPQAVRLFWQDIGNFLPYTFIVIIILLLTRMVGTMGTVVNILLANQLIAGYFVAGAALEKGQKRGIANYFTAFEFIQPISFFSLVQFLVNVLLFLPFLLLVGYNMFRLDLLGESAFPYWSFLLLVPLFYLNLAWRWTPALMIFYHMDLWPAMETSRRLITRNILIQVVHVLVLGIPFMIPFALRILKVDIDIQVSGILSLLLLGYSFGADYCAFADVVDLLEQRKEEVDLMDHLIEPKE